MVDYLTLVGLTNRSSLQVEVVMLLNLNSESHLLNSLLGIRLWGQIARIYGWMKRIVLGCHRSLSTNPRSCLFNLAHTFSYIFRVIKHQFPNAKLISQLNPYPSNNFSFTIPITSPSNNPFSPTNLHISPTLGINSSIPISPVPTKHQKSPKSSIATL